VDARQLFHYRAMKFRQLILLALLVALSAQVRGESLFFGEVPVQYVTHSDEITLDFRRFLHPPKATVKIEGMPLDHSHLWRRHIAMNGWKACGWPG